MAQLVSLTLIRWIVIYLVDSAIQLLTNWGQKSIITLYWDNRSCFTILAKNVFPKFWHLPAYSARLFRTCYGFIWEKYCCSCSLWRTEALNSLQGIKNGFGILGIFTYRGLVGFNLNPLNFWSMVSLYSSRARNFRKIVHATVPI